MFMKNWMLLFVLVFACAIAQAQSTGLGLRIGESTGFTLKKYFNNGHAFEISAGATGYFYNRGYKAGKWESGGLALMGNYVVQIPVPEAEGLEIYVGGGGSAKLRSFRYNSGFGEGLETATRISFALNGVAGVEYHFSDAPVTLFLDVIPYIEVMPYIARPGLDGGLGARFNF